MIELIQFPWSPFCIVQRRVLQFTGKRFKTTNLRLTGDRSLVWKLTHQRYYGVPVIRDGNSVVFETSDDSQVIAKYLDAKFQIGLFPKQHEGVQEIVWRYIENEIESVGFKLNDVYYKEFVKPEDQLSFIRHKERKFGRGCLDEWRRQQKTLLNQIAEKLLPFEAMLNRRDFLLDGRPRFVDFDLFGMLGNFLYSGHYQLPARHSRLKKWYQRMETIKFDEVKKV